MGGSLLKYLIGLIMLVLLSSAGYSQIIKGAVMAGMNLSQVDGDEIYGFHKFGLNIGASAIVPVANKWEASIETIFTQKGSYQKPHYDDSLTGEYKLKLNYLEVPVLFHYNDKNRVAFGVGLSWGRLVGVEEYEHGRRVETTNLNGPYDKNDFNVLLDVRFKIYKRLKFNVRYAYSIDKIRTRVFTPPYSTDSWTRDQYNNFWTFRLVYIFNEEQSERIRNENR
jgi:hypothetical protein